MGHLAERGQCGRRRCTALPVLGMALALAALGACGNGTDSPAPPRRPSQAELAWPFVAPLLRPGQGDEQKAIAIAAWVAANATNEPSAGDAPVPPIRGQCGRRADVFVELARRAGLRAARLDFSRFGSSAHSAAQVSYDGGWHYFDATYAGYFRRGNRILSFAEIQADPAAALAGLVVLPGGGLDRWLDGTPVDNGQRMRQAYTLETIATAQLRVPRAEPFGVAREKTP
jgi:hypothetical protein